MATATDSSAECKTPGYLAFKKCTTDLVAAVQSETGEFSDVLFGEGFIGDDVRQTTLLPAVLDSHKARIMLAAVIIKIALDPEAFHKFLKISPLSRDHNRSVALKLKEAYEHECLQEQLKNEDHEQPTCSKQGPKFPYLEAKALTQNERYILENKLEKETRQIVQHFYHFSTAIEKSLELQAENPKRLKQIKGAVLNFECIAKEHKEEIKAGSQVIDIFNTLRASNYITFFNYYIIEILVKEFGSNDDSKKLDAYLEELRKFCERSVFEVPKSLFDCELREGSKVLALKCTEHVITLNDVQKKMRELVKVFSFAGANLSDFHLCTIEKGCVELHFLVSAAVAERVFPVTPPQHSALSEIGVRVIDPQESNREETIPSLTASTEAWTYSRDSETSPKLTELSEKLMNACRNGKLSELTDILKEAHLYDLDINKMYGHTTTPLIAACAGGHTETAKLLIDRGAEVDKCDEDNKSPLLWACSKGHTETAELLINNNAEVDKCNKGGQSPLWEACTGGHTETAKLLIDRGAAVDKLDNVGHSPLWIAAAGGHTRTVELLIKHGDKPDKCIYRGQSALWWACAGGHTETAKLLIDRGAEVDIFDKDGCSPIAAAFRKGHNETVQLLEGYGATLTDEEKQKALPKTITQSLKEQHSVDSPPTSTRSGGESETSKSDSGFVSFNSASVSPFKQRRAKIASLKREPRISEGDDESDHQSSSHSPMKPQEQNISVGNKFKRSSSMETRFDGSNRDSDDSLDA